jgi:hypothetical protein
MDFVVRPSPWSSTTVSFSSVAVAENGKQIPVKTHVKSIIYLKKNIRVFRVNEVNILVMI